MNLRRKEGRRINDSLKERGRERGRDLWCVGEPREEDEEE